MGLIKWLLGGFIGISLIMIGGLIYHAVAFEGGLPSWVLAAVWLVAAFLIVGVVLKSVAGQGH